MLRINGIGSKNLRSLKNLTNIPLKPITILVGKNSAGKSTFARLLPLLKQSSEKRKQAPILWWGRLVDFGTFDDAQSTSSKDGFIDISISFEVTEHIFAGATRFYYRPKSLPLTNPNNIESTFRLVKNNDDATIIKELRLNVFGVSIILEFNEGEISTVFLNSKKIEIPSNIRLFWQQGQLMPLVRMANIGPNSQATSVSDEAFFSPRRVSRFGAQIVRDAASRFLHGNTQEDRKEEIADRLPIAPIDDFLKYCQSLSNSTTTWKNIFEQTTINSNSVIDLHAAVILYKLEPLLWVLDDVAQSFLTNVNYLEPLRATAQRYYRREEISAEELDPKGLNTPFFIQGLTPREKDSLNSWTKDNFGFSLSIENSGGHVSLNIKPEHDGATSRNMADVGLGYSQIVPVALQLWAARYRATRDATRKASIPRGLVSMSRGRTLVVEQPELHLHPAYQAKLADVFAKSIAQVDQKENDRLLTIVAETHSPNLIARLGELINAGQLSESDVQILVFENSENPEEGTSARIATFDAEGILRNWPIGFFDA